MGLGGLSGRAPALLLEFRAQPGVEPGGDGQWEKAAGRQALDGLLNHASALTERPVTQLVYRRHGGENNIKEFVALNYQWWKLLL